ncbi:unnamed protein product [Caenorhabditis auriculariae]|uniref:Uncharacterized protein n=1 Tax=Caenorhabditis auriculariae TaxID=2777116 RepID=A0A8S1GPK8_9PELO|nr:unnamed protein product [Caenorhabditis auriculariae]
MEPKPEKHRPSAIIPNQRPRKAYQPRQKQWAGHVIRRTDDRWSTRVTSWIRRNTRRTRGRPATRWVDHFKKNISRHGRHWMTVARDRDAWRTCGSR